MLPFSTLMKLEKKFFFHSLILVKNGEQIFNTGIKDLFISEQIFNTGIKDLFYSDGKKWLNLINFFHHNSMIFWKMLRIFWFIQKIENLKINFSHTKWVKTLKFFFQNWMFSKKVQNFLKNAQNLLIHPENEKSKNLYFPIQNGSKHL